MTEHERAIIRAADELERMYVLIDETPPGTEEESLAEFYRRSREYQHVYSDLIKAVRARREAVQ